MDIANITLLLSEIVTYDAITSLDQHSTTEKETYEQTYPVNLTIALIIIFQNVLVIYDYFPNRRKLTTLLFILIAGVDIVLALGEIVRSIHAITCMYDTTTTVPPWVFYTLPDITQFGWTCSVYFNLVLTLYRTATLSRPFDRIDKTTVIIAIISGPAFWFLVILSDNLSLPSDPISSASCDDVWMRDGSSFIARDLMNRVISHIIEEKGSIDDNISRLILSVPLIPAFIIPCLITFVCVPIQVHYLRESLSTSANSQISRESDHVTITIILVSSLFVVTNGLSTLLILVNWFFNDLLLTIFAMYTLPMINGVGFPLIMIIRKPSLRDRFKGYIITPIRLLTRAFSVIIARFHGYKWYKEMEYSQRLRCLWYSAKRFIVVRETPTAQAGLIN